jgi:hypothetical protein
LEYLCGLHGVGIDLLEERSAILKSTAGSAMKNIKRPKSKRTSKHPRKQATSRAKQATPVKKAATKNYVKPEIASVTHGFGIAAIAISFFGAIILAAEEEIFEVIAIVIGFSGSLTGIALMALAVIVDRTARTAYNTSVISDLISSDSGKVKKLLFEQVQVQNKILDSQQVPQIAELSYYLADAPEEPVSLSTLNEMYSTGGIDESTSVFREGDSDWSTYGDFME